MVVISSFGTGELPKLDGKGLIQDVVYLRNQEYWGINNLEITNDSGVEDSTLRTGVHIYASDFGTVHNIFLSNLYIHNINGDLSDKENGGILCEIAGSAVQTIFDSLVITGCKIIDIDRTGISLNSSWATRTLTTNTKWIPSTNVIIRNNWIERSGCNGMIIRVSARPLIEYNTFKQCALKGSGNAMFLFNCDDGLVQFNESYLTVYNTGDADASGFDSDYQCKRSVFQYNYSHDNDGGFMLVCCQGGVGRFNDGTIVRYNISQNDGGNTAWSGRSIIRVSGQTTNTVFYNNVLYSNAATNFRAAIYHKSWAAFPDSTSYYNNIFYLQNTPAYIFYGSTDSSTNNFFDHNVFFGKHSASDPVDLNAITSDPMFVFPGSGSVGFNTLSGYRLLENSPCINSGILLTGQAAKDFFGNSVPDLSGSVDRGVYEGFISPTGYADADTYVMGGTSGDINFYNDSTNVLRIRGYVYPNNKRNIYLRFNLKSFSGYISRAAIKLTAKLVVANAGTENRINVYSVENDNWDPTTLTWNNAPSFGDSLTGTIIKTKASTAPDTSYDFDITEYAKKEYAKDSIVSVCLADTISTSTSDIRFWSSRAPGNAGPLLLINGITSVKAEEVQPVQFALMQNYPNPFNPTTQINYRLSSTQHVVLKVFDVLGNQVRILVNEEKPRGEYTIAFDGNGLASGIYFYSIQAGNNFSAKKMILAK